jgi:hypothetical protein
MEPTVHAFSELFAQLGLPDDAASIRAFIATHAPLADDIRLVEDDPLHIEGHSEKIRGLVLKTEFLKKA